MKQENPSLFGRRRSSSWLKDFTPERTEDKEIFLQKTDDPKENSAGKKGVVKNYLGNAAGMPPSMGRVAPVVGVRPLAKKTTAFPTCSAVTRTFSRFLWQ